MKNSFNNNIHILCVEDDAMNQMIVKTLLRNLGFKKISMAGDAKEAISLLEIPNTDINFILMDLGLPDISGIELTKKIRQSHWAVKDIPIVALTGNDADVAKEDSLAAGMNDFLTKPINVERLKNILETLIEKK